VPYSVVRSNDIVVNGISLVCSYVVDEIGEKVVLVISTSECENRHCVSGIAVISLHGHFVDRVFECLNSRILNV
jgi:hypothetical protein